MEELIPVNILIGDRTYRLKIEPKDEESVRKSIKLINDKILEFKTNFSGKDMQDYIAMVLIWLATEKNKSGADWVKLEQSAEKLQSLEDLLDKVLEK
ncbi:cell division protein ZapA [Danxiaibacter flavus]|jgi:cell division protein ZapA (FtsZ GTPase activity inhibitor)|uniref:Cell division protein ZapA n=1 Tax=Danxiaibacter flavus TaxID=3049108 RepID=A0ABV3ZG46_9BACT|nr:cell division protein ZapA [Chitinophagaceae bacterium DXS]